MRILSAISMIIPMVLCCAATQAQVEVPRFDAAQPEAAFRAMAQYLSAEGGRWRADNPNYDEGNERSPPAFGLWFEWDSELEVLSLEIVVYFSDRTLVSSSGQWLWHPGNEQLDYTTKNRNGSLSRGTTDFSEPSTFTTTATLYGRSGKSSVHRDVNRLVGPSVHHNETFAAQPDGSWQSQGIYEWRRETAEQPP